MGLIKKICVNYDTVQVEITRTPYMKEYKLTPEFDKMLMQSKTLILVRAHNGVRIYEPKK